MSDHNPMLQAWLKRASAQDVAAKGDESSIERPQAVQNLRWQTRPAAPTEYENALGSALQAIFAEQVYELPAIIARLNAGSVRAPHGAAWTEDNFTAEMARLGF